MAVVVVVLGGGNWWAMFGAGGMGATSAAAYLAAMHLARQACQVAARAALPQQLPSPASALPPPPRRGFALQRPGPGLPRCWHGRLSRAGVSGAMARPWRGLGGVGDLGDGGLCGRGFGGRGLQGGVRAGELVVVFGVEPPCHLFVFRQATALIKLIQP